ncbi:MAG: transporter [Burkholderiales bacterium]|nr:transporter [Burkholderiales bacterium]
MKPQSKLPMIAISIGFFLVIMDVTMVIVALPQLPQSLHSSVSQLQWVVDGYTLTFACFLLTAGYLGDLFGAKKMYLYGLAGFIITSLGCGLAPNAATLISFRLLQGFFASLLIPTSLTLINNVYKEDKARASAIAFWASSGAIAAACGPVLGGILVNYYSWRSVFLVNLPVGIIAIYLSSRYTMDIVHKIQKVNFDIFGQLLIIISIAALSYSLIEAPNLGWTSSYIIWSFTLFILTFIIFLFVEARQAYPMVDISLFKNPHFSASAVLGIFLSFGFYGFLFIMPLYLHTIKHFTPLQIGFALFPFTVLMLLGNILSGKMYGKYGARFPILWGFAMSILGFLLLFVLVHNDLPYTIMIFPLLVMGMACALIMPALTAVILNAAPKSKAGFASAMFNTSRQLGSLLGVAVLGTIINMAPNLILGMDISLLIAAAGYVVSVLLTLIFIKPN